MRGVRIPAERINRARAARGWSVSDLAEISRIGLATASRACTGKPISSATVRRLAEAFRSHPADQNVLALLRGQLDELPVGPA